MVESLLKGKESPTVISPVKSEGLSRGGASKTPLPARITIPSQSPQESLGQATEIGVQGAEYTQSSTLGSAPKTSELPKSIAIPPSPTTDKAALRPTLFLGVGGLVCSTIRNVEYRLQKKFSHLSPLSLFHFLCFHTHLAGVRPNHHHLPRIP